MKIYPKEELFGIYDIPSDKYALHCAIVAAGLVKGKTTIIGRAGYNDVAQTVACVKRLGARIKIKGDAMEIRGVKEFKEGTYRLECGNSGSTMRLLCGVAAGAKVNAVLVGGKYLSKRSMEGVKEPLEMMGATVALTDYTVPPIWVEGAKVRAIEYEAERLGAQEKAAVLFAAVAGGERVVIRQKKPKDDSAEKILKELGAKISVSGEAITLEKSELAAGKTLYIAGDAHAASVVLTLGLTLGKVTVKNVCLNPLKSRFIEAVRRMGGDITVENERLLCGETIADITAVKSKLKAIHLDGEETAALLGDIPIIAVLMGVAEGESIIADGKAQGSGGVPRLDYICEAINAIGGNAKRFEGGLIIKGVEKYAGGSIKTYSDHKIALAGAVALAASRYGGEIDDESCASVSFPGFFDNLKHRDIGVVGKDLSANAAFNAYAFLLKRSNAAKSVSKYQVPADNPRRFFSELKLHAGYNAFYPYTSEAMRSVRLSQSANYLRTMDAATGGTGYSFLGGAVVLAAKYAGESFVGKKTLVIGGGNAARSIIHALISEKARVFVYDSDFKTALDISRRTKGAAVAEDKPSGEYYAVINASLAGSGYYEDELPFPEGADIKFDLAIDLAISKSKTPFKTYAESKNAKTIDGYAAAFLTVCLSNAAFFGRTMVENEAFAALSDYENVL